MSAVLLDIHILLRWLDDDPRFGAYEVERDEYQQLLNKALALKADFHGLAGGGTSEEVLQAVSQTS